MPRHSHRRPAMRRSRPRTDSFDASVRLGLWVLPDRWPLVWYDSIPRRDEFLRPARAASSVGERQDARPLAPPALQLDTFRDATRQEVAATATQVAVGLAAAP